ncbi:MAG: hypothetical protein JWP01_3099 [Myxococcales bacterium]|nr:hypothetical protein [Myxococcales bacterium]
MRSLVISIAVALGLGLAAPASAKPPMTHQVIYTKPSGFWTNPNPAVGGSYRWRLLGIGVVLLGITGYGMMRLVRKAAAERAARFQ